MTEKRLPDAETWVDEYGDYLYKYALLRLRDPVLAEDVVQETFLSALDSHDRYEGRSSAKTWFVGILKHKIADHIRKLSRERPADDAEIEAVVIENPFDKNGKWRQAPSKWDIDPRMAFERKEFRETLDLCLSELTPRLSEAFVLREMEELDSDEVCKVLGISATNLWVMLHRARMRLRRCLEINWFEQAPERDE